MDKLLLLIENDQDIMEMLAGILDVAGFRVVGVSFPVAPAAFYVDAFDIAMVDLMLDGARSGIEVAKGLREAGFDKPIIAMSASPDMVRLAEESGYFTVALTKDNPIGLAIEADRLLKA